MIFIGDEAEVINLFKIEKIELQYDYLYPNYSYIIIINDKTKFYTYSKKLFNIIDFVNKMLELGKKENKYVIYIDEIVKELENGRI